jgi:Ca2+-binding EF-hand superfamily protein
VFHSAFALMDTQNKGYLVQSEILQSFLEKSMTSKLAESLVESLMQFDADMNQRLDQSEWLQFLHAVLDNTTRPLTSAAVQEYRDLFQL